ncbi:MAG TPA: FAD-dependent monooxygenase [Candidatus Limnocylindria bacterium]|nr:FAD-dependent monooxygenase [Candidatus Limnocylindria bacterium]
MRRPRVLVVGGGIGGMTAAIALRRRGLDAVVFERAASIERVQLGAGLHLWSNALRALQVLALDRAVVDIGTVMTRQRYLDSRGRSLGDLDVGRVSSELGAPTVAVTRPDFHRLLVDALAEVGPDALRFGAECTGFYHEPDSVTAKFADGTEERGDVLVGADGIASAVRAQLHGAEPPSYSGYTAWRALCDFSHPRLPVGEMWIYWGPGARILHYHVSDQRVYWLAMAKAPARTPDPPEGRKAAALARYRGWASPVEELIESTDEAAIIHQDVVDRDPIPRWGASRVTLLGDAAHPMTPNLAQGAGQAIEDGVSLATVLASSADPVEGLRAYERRRAERANGMIKVSRMVGRMSLLESPVARAVRDNVVLRSIYATYDGRRVRRDLTPVL